MNFYEQMTELYGYGYWPIEWLLAVFFLFVCIIDGFAEHEIFRWIANGIRKSFATLMKKAGTTIKRLAK